MQKEKLCIAHLCAFERSISVLGKCENCAIDGWVGLDSFWAGDWLVGVVTVIRAAAAANDGCWLIRGMGLHGRVTAVRRAERAGPAVP